MARDLFFSYSDVGFSPDFWPIYRDENKLQISNRQVDVNDHKMSVAQKLPPLPQIYERTQSRSNVRRQNRDHSSHIESQISVGGSLDSERKRKRDRKDDFTGSLMDYPSYWTGRDPKPVIYTMGISTQ